jgi:hypothetical protein
MEEEARADTDWDAAQEAHPMPDASGTPTEEVSGRSDNVVIDVSDDAQSSWTTLLGDTRDLASRWDAVQAGFVDEPRRAVEEADALVRQVMERLDDSFGRERSRLEAQWSRGDDVGTEDLRVALRHYRTFFNVLLSGPQLGSPDQETPRTSATSDR